MWLIHTWQDDGDMKIFMTYWAMDDAEHKGVHGQPQPLPIQGLLKNTLGTELVFAKSAGTWIEWKIV